MGELERAKQVTGDRRRFEEISRVKLLYESMLTDCANELNDMGLAAKIAGYRGCKVSKGNELLSCPYQVLDIGRTFGQADGFNIRILNWWARGTFVFLALGSSHPLVKQFISEKSLRGLIALEYYMPEGGSMWDYPEIIDEKNYRLIDQSCVASLISAGQRLFLFKQIQLQGDVSEGVALLMEEVCNVFELLGV